MSWLHVRCKSLPTELCYIEDSYLANAVSLKSGAVAEFNDNDKVIFVRTKLVSA
jgi:hypothetical protein